MNHGKYSIKKFLTDHSLEQIIIPEIQRDYVWSKENVEGLLDSINSDFEEQKVRFKNIDDSSFEKMEPSIKEIVMRSLSENRVYSNIGFIYAYHNEVDVSSKYFLIDGQQRITTMFLLLLAVSIKGGKENVFRNNYFAKKYPKVDYKVREAAHDFLIEFVEFILSGNKIEEVKEEYWYYSLYESDKTIQSIITNYKIIQNYVSKSGIDFSFVEDNIELYYFDTEKSEQGEELYIYMNSRGEAVQPNENIKAQLLEGLSEVDKHNKGKEWEVWQNFFWKNKKKNENADNGFIEFLKWIKIIEYNINESGKTQKDSGDYIRNLRLSKKISRKYLSFEKIERYYNALQKLYKDNKYIEEKWLSADTDATDYIRLLPVLQFCDKYPNSTLEQQNRFSRFFFNLARKEEIGKNSPDNTAQAIRLTHDFLTNNFIDVIDFVHIDEIKRYSSIVNSEEIFKLNLFANVPNGFLREDVEREIWAVEDLNLLLGSISFILHCIDFNKENINDFNFNRFSVYSKHFNALFNTPNDLLRRALLTFGDYSIYHGYSPTLELSRYNFGSDSERWRRILKEDYKENAIKQLLSFFENKESLVLTLEYDSQLLEIINDYPNKNKKIDWMHYLIVHDELLKYCLQKNICIGNGETYLLLGEKATTYKDINELIKI